MTDEVYGATIAKRCLSRRLAEFRITAGYTANQVCDMLNWGRGKVGRFEANQWKRPEMSDIRDLVRIYQVGDAEREEVERLAVRCRVRPWWRDYGEIFCNEFPGYENDATSIRAYMPLVLPGLLQTPAYMEAQLSTGSRPSSWRRAAVEARLRRQQILNRTDGTAPGLSVVITEASLLYRWGGREDRRAQLEHLTALSRRHAVDLRIQRFEDGPAGIHSMVNILGFPGDEPALVFEQTDYSVTEVSNPESQAGYIRSFERACRAALAAEEATIYLEKLAQRAE